jgi:hypothetical protein
MELKTFIFILGLIVSFSGSINAQCPPGPITLLTQADVDNFTANYPGCTELNAALVIGPSTDITNLNGLSGITKIANSLEIFKNDILTDASGLNNLNFIGTAITVLNNDLLPFLDFTGVSSTNMVKIEVRNNPVLSSFNAPNAVQTLSGNLFFDNNFSLSTFTGLQNLNSIGGALEINDTKAVSLPSFANLIFVGVAINFFNNENVLSIDLKNVNSTNMVKLQVVNNAALQSFSAPELITTLSDDLFFDNNFALSSLTGFDALTSVGGHLEINDTKATTFPSFPNLTFVGQAINFVKNENVLSIDLQNVSSINMVDVKVLDNASLTSFSGPQFIPSLSGNLLVNNNFVLSSLTGFDALTSIGGELAIEDTQDPVLPAFQQLNFVGKAIIYRNNNLVSDIDLSNVGSTNMKDVIIRNNPQLNHFGAPKNVPTLSNDIDIQLNSNLASITGFDALTSIERLLLIEDTKVSSVPGLGSLQTTGEFWIGNNENITTLDWFSSLSTIENYLSIRENPNLSFCAIAPVCDFLPGAGGRVVQNNSDCCLNETTLTNACNGDPAFEEICDGQDNNCDGQIDEGGVCPEPIPTMGQWGLFLFSLIICNLGLVFLYNAQRGEMNSRLPQ